MPPEILLKGMHKSYSLKLGRVILEKTTTKDNKWTEKTLAPNTRHVAHFCSPGLQRWVKPRGMNFPPNAASIPQRRPQLVVVPLTDICPSTMWVMPCPSTAWVTTFTWELTRPQLHFHCVGNNIYVGTHASTIALPLRG